MHVRCWKTEASIFGPQQAGDKFNRTRRIESGYLFRGDGEDCVRHSNLESRFEFMTFLTRGRELGALCARLPRLRGSLPMRGLFTPAGGVDDLAGALGVDDVALAVRLERDLDPGPLLGQQ
jgi:hypothetical protein